MLECKNCSNSFEGTYCPACGQKYIDKRLTLKESLYWVANSLFNLEKGFFYTTKEVIRKPGKVNKDFLGGITIPYVHPFRFLFIWATISAILAIYTTAIEDSSTLFSDPNVAEKQMKFMKSYLSFMKKYMSLFVMGLIPLMSLASYLVLKRKKLNYAEHLVINSFGNASSIIISIPINLGYFFLENTKVIPSITFILSILVMGRVYAQSFNDSLIAGILKYALTFILGMFFFLIVFVTLLLCFLFGMKAMGYDNPFQ